MRLTRESSRFAITTQRSALGIVRQKLLSSPVTKPGERSDANIRAASFAMGLASLVGGGARHQMHVLEVKLDRYHVAEPDTRGVGRLELNAFSGGRSPNHSDVVAEKELLFNADLGVFGSNIACDTDVLRPTHELNRPGDEMRPAARKLRGREREAAES